MLRRAGRPRRARAPVRPGGRCRSRPPCSSARGRRRPGLRLASFAVLAAAAAVALPAAAQTTETLVSNTGGGIEVRLEIGGVDARRLAQWFTTGDAAAYTLSSVQLRIENYGSGDSAGVRIHSKNASGDPSAQVHVLSNPGAFSHGLNTFTAPADAGGVLWINPHGGRG